MKLCNFTARVISDEQTQIHHISPLKHVISQLKKAEKFHILAVNCKFTSYSSGEITISPHFIAKLCLKIAVKKKQLFTAYLTHFSDFTLPGLLFSSMLASITFQISSSIYVQIHFSLKLLTLNVSIRFNVCLPYVGVLGVCIQLGRAVCTERKSPLSSDCDST